MSSTLGALLHGRRLASMLASHSQLSLLRAGLDSGLFAALRKAKPVEAIVSETGYAEDLVRAWLGAAAGHGLVERRGDAYQCGGLPAWLLEDGVPESMRAMLDQADLTYGPTLRALPELLRGGPRPEFGGADASRRAALIPRALEGRALSVLARVPGARRPSRVLDVGCGYGTYLAGVLARRRDALGVGVELDADVAEGARRTLRDRGLAQRGEIKTGDFMVFDLGLGSFDLVLLNNNLHYFDAQERSALFARVFEHLSPEGTVVIQMPLAAEGALARALGSGAMLATFDLFLRSHANLHGLPSRDTVVDELRTAGLIEPGWRDVVPDGSTVFVWARRP